MNLRRYFSALYWLVLVGFGLTSATFFWQTYAEYNRLQATQASNQRQQAALEARLAQQKTELERLTTDHEFVEKKIRQDLHYARAGEYVFRFEQ